MTGISLSEIKIFRNERNYLISWRWVFFNKINRMRSSAPKVITKVFVRQEKESSQRRQRVERTRIVILTLRLKIHLRVLNHDTKRINTMFHNLEKLIKLINLIILRKEVYIGLTLCPMLRLNDH